MDRTTKEEFVVSLRAALNTASLVVVAQQKGMTVAQVSDLRRKMRSEGASYKVAKNTLARLAVQGTKFSGIEKMLSGPTTLAYSQDPIVAAKILVQYAKTNDKIVVLGGCLNGEVLNAQAINSLASLPSLDELRGKLVGMLVTPATRLAVLAQAPAAQLARVLNAYATK